MATSQFTIYTAGDQGGPGFITGTSGSLISILDACLVNGYPGKPAAGWTKPFPTTNSYAAYTQGSGSMMTMFVNDNNPNVGVGREAHVTGWIAMTSLSGSNTTSASNQGVGYGQFPLQTQTNGVAQSVSGSVIWRKSADTTTPRYWIIAADAWTVYIWIATGDSAGTYLHGGFGEFYSLAGPTDKGKVLIFGRCNVNGSSGTNNDGTDSLGASTFNNSTAYATAMPAHFLARGVGGTGFSTTFTKKGASDLSTVAISAGLNLLRMDGWLVAPHPLDNSYYLASIYLIENTAINLRGKFRGIWHVCHQTNSFTDGQIIQGSGNLAGRSFMIIKLGQVNAGMWGLEISNTVDTN